MTSMEIADDDALFDDEDVASNTQGSAPQAIAQVAWSVLLVDDERDVHAVTRMALSGLLVDGRPVEIISAYSRNEAERTLLEHREIALAILDVVMETDDAGLQLARHIRQSYPDRAVRLVLRTGQPGVAPEEKVLRDYDINDYWAKTELTAMRMRTLVTGNLRSCRDLRTIETHRAGLTRVIASTATLFKPLGIDGLVQAILSNLTEILPTKSAALFFVEAGSERTTHVGDAAQVLGATGRFAGSVGKRIEEVLDPTTLALIRRSIKDGVFISEENFACFGYRMTGQPSTAIFMDSVGSLDPVDCHIVELFCRNAASAFQNQRMTEERLSLLSAVSRFVPNRLLSLLGHDDVGRISLGDHVELEMTVLFGDLQSFARLAERMSSAETFELLKCLHSFIGPAIAKHGGIVDKYLGDGIMVLFPEGPETCVRAGADVLAAVEAMNRERVARGDVPLVLGLGAHHGSVTVGTLGFAERMETTVVSDAVNVAARLEQLTRHYRCSMVFSEQVHRSLPEPVREDSRCLGTIPIKGRDGSIRIFEAFGADSARDAKRRTKERFALAVKHLEEGRWPEALTEFDRVLDVNPGDGAARVLKEHALLRSRG